MRTRLIRALIVSALICLFGIGMLSAESVSAQGCYQTPRLIVGNQAMVMTYPALPNRIRNQPAYYGSVLGFIPAGGYFSVLGGPACDGATNWWYVTYGNVTGWTAEGDGGGNYWVQPVYNNPTPAPACWLPARLTIGIAGRVTPGLPNILRSGAGTIGTARVGTIPAGGVFSVLNGPVCAADGRNWWQVSYNGIVGWTAEGSQTSYWVEPYPGDGPQCVLPNRLWVGGFGRVTPGTPNVVRTAPGTNATGSNSAVIGQIPGGGVFYVMGGPSCGTDNRWWWYVSYGNLVGWTAEGEGWNSYWVEPY